MTYTEIATRQEFRLKTYVRVLYILGGVVFLAVGGAFAYGMQDTKDRAFGLLMGLFFILCGATFAIMAIRSRMVIENDVIEVCSLFRTRSARRDEISGTRQFQSRNGKWTTLYLKQGGSLNVSDSLDGQDAFTQWLQGVPDLDQRDADEIQREIDAENIPGSMIEGGSKFLANAKAWNIGLMVLGGLAFIGMLQHDAKMHLYSALVLVLLTPAAIYLLNRFPLSFTALKSKKDPRTDMSFLIMLPGIGMLVASDIGGMPTSTLDVRKVMLWGALLLAGMVVSLLPSARRNPRGWTVVFGLAMFAAFYAFSAVNTLNKVLDHSQPKYFATRVAAKHVSHGKSTTYYLRMSPWGPRQVDEDIAVPSSKYENTSIGDLLCAGLHPGMLKIEWYTLSSCPDGVAIDQIGRNNIANQNGVTRPVLIHPVRARMTDEARAANFSGEVIVSATIDEHGFPRDVRVVRPVGMGLDESAVAALQASRFLPATKDGKPISVHVQGPIHFQVRPSGH